MRKIKLTKEQYRQLAYNIQKLGLPKANIKISPKSILSLAKDA